MTISVLLVDDHEIVRRGLRELLGNETDIRVVAEAATIAEALTRAAQFNPDIAIVDIRLPDGSGIQLCQRFRESSQHTRCLILTAFDNEETLIAAIAAGAAGYLLKQVRGHDVVTAVREVVAGRSLLDPVTTARVLNRIHSGETVRNADRSATLTDQERRILGLIGEGMTNRQIAERLLVAEKTVKNHVTSILAKLGMERRTQAAAWIARRSG